MEYKKPKAFYDNKADKDGLLQYHIKLKKAMSQDMFYCLATRKESDL